MLGVSSMAEGACRPDLAEFGKAEERELGQGKPIREPHPGVSKDLAGHVNERSGKV